MTHAEVVRVSLGTIMKEWGRIGSTGFGGPPTHIALLRKLCVDQREWIAARDFEDGIAATNLLPGPASTQLAIFCAWRLRGWVGAVVGGVFFIAPGLILILALSTLFLASNPPLWVLGAAAGAGAAVPAVAIHAAIGLMPASRKRMRDTRRTRIRWVVYLAVGIAAGALAGTSLVLVLIASGLIEIVLTRDWHSGAGNKAASVVLLPILPPVGAVAGLGALVWVALKVGLLSYGGGFVIIPLMQHDAVSTYHWMTGAQFLNAVALGQITPGPVVQTVAVVGYAAAGLGGGLLAALIAFVPSFLFIIFGGRYFDRLRANPTIQAFLTGAGATVIGAIAGSAIPLGLALTQFWQAGILAAALLWLLASRRGVVLALIGAGIIGVIAVLIGAPVSH
ncbi:MAG: chromate transporter [Microbacteriaceae bacterium]|nr:chromate transporter [Microbacteriaceae bacterium]